MRSGQPGDPRAAGGGYGTPIGPLRVRPQALLTHDMGVPGRRVMEQEGGVMLRGGPHACYLWTPGGCWLLRKTLRPPCTWIQILLSPIQFVQAQIVLSPLREARPCVLPDYPACICMCSHVSLCVHVSVCVFAFICMCSRVLVCVCMCLHLFTCVCMCSHVSSCVCMRLHVFAGICVCSQPKPPGAGSSCPIEVVRLLS